MRQLLMLDYRAFPGVTVDAMVLLAERSPKPAHHEVEVSRITRDGARRTTARVLQGAWSAARGITLQSADTTHDKEAMERSGRRLADVACVYFGLQTRDRARWLRDTPPDAADPSPWQPCVDGRDVSPYRVDAPRRWVCTEACATKSGADPRIQARPRLLVRQLGACPIAARASASIWALNTLYQIYVEDDDADTLCFILGVLNSGWAARWWEGRAADHKPLFPKVKKRELLDIPLPNLSRDALEYAQLVALVRRAEAGEPCQEQIEALLGELFS